MSVRKLACLGGEPAFAKPLPVGQLYFPSWERYEAAFRDIFDRQYYTNQGPLVDEFEWKLEQFLQVKNVVCVTNATIGLMMVVEALELKGRIILPAFTFAASAQALSWTGATPVFCDVSEETHQIEAAKISELITSDVSAVMGVNLWGGSCNPAGLEQLCAQKGLNLFFDSAHAFGCAVNGKPIGGFGSAEVFSFHATKVLSATEGGCITTNDDNLAARLRNIRSSYGARFQVKVNKTSNGRMSEAQAAIGLMSLDDFPRNQQNNAALHAIYSERLASVPGISIVTPQCVSSSNYQYAVFRLDEKAFGLSRNKLIEALKAENVIARRYFYPGLHRSMPYEQQYPEYLKRLPVTDKLCEQCFQLPLGALVTLESVASICDLIKVIHSNAVKVSTTIGVLN